MTLKDFDDNLDCTTLQELATRLGLTRKYVQEFLASKGVSFPKYRAEKGYEKPPRRSSIPIDWGFVREKLKSRTAATSIAKVLGVSVQVFYDRCQAEQGMSFQQLRAECQAEGEDTLKNKMYELAMAGNTQMLIWLSRNWMKYHDRQEDSTAEETTVQVNFIRK
jgi:AraC-like DNA-binding protein